jgi:hypothetical protein
MNNLLVDALKEAEFPDMLDVVYLIHVSSEPLPSVLLSLSKQIQDLSYDEFVQRYTSVEGLEQWRQDVGEIEEMEFNEVKRKLAVGDRLWDERDKYILATIAIKVLDSFTTVEEIIGNPALTHAVFFYLSNTPDPVGAEFDGFYKIVVPFKFTNIEAFKQAYTYDVWTIDHMDPNALNIDLDAIFYNELYAQARPPEMAIYMDVLSIPVLKEVVNA